MSVKIQINSLAALEKLIGNDNELEIEVRRSVVNDFAKKHLKNIADETIVSKAAVAVKNEVENQFFDVVQQGWYEHIVFKPDVIEKLKGDLKVAVDSQLSSLVALAVDEQKSLKTIEARIDRAVKFIDSQLSEEKLEQRLDFLVEKRLKERLGLK